MANSISGIIFDTHVKGFTKHHPAVPEHLQETYAGLATPDVIGYIKSLGVTSVELPPVHAFIDDSDLLEKGLVNYGGYNSIGFSAPDTRYGSAPEQTLREFEEMVARFREAGLETIMDDWADPAMRCFGMVMDGRARPTGVRQRGTEAAMLIVLNAHHDLVEFGVPTIEGATHWALELDTNVIGEVPRYKGGPGERYGVTWALVSTIHRVGRPPNEH
jgi:hypothetical protein